MGDIDKIKEIIKNNIDSFLSRIEDKCDQKEFNRFLKRKVDFECFGTANKEYYEYVYLERILLKSIRDELINPLLFDLFEEYNIDYSTISCNYGQYLPSNEEFERAHKVEFYFIKQHIGIRYTIPHFTSLERWRLKYKYGIKEIWYIEFDLNSRLKKSSKYKTIRFNDFLCKLFGEEIANIVSNSIKEAVQTANEIIGFKTIPKLSLRNTGTFRSSINHLIVDEKNKIFSFESIQRKIPISEELDFSDSDQKKLYNRYYNSGFYRILIGDSDVAKCFLTSEYLFSIFEEDPMFDYTAIVAGYFKSVELLLEHVVFAQLARIDGDISLEKLKNCYWITAKHGRLKGIKKCLPNSINKSDVLSNNNMVFKSTPANAEADRHIIFVPKLKKYFNTTMQSLINCIYDNDFYDVSEDGARIIYDTLTRYTIECRNGHFHKDIIDSFNQVKMIRHNTLLVLYLIIGSCILDEDDEYIINVANNEFYFNELYKAINKVPMSVNKFLIEFEANKPIIARRLIYQEKPKYNDMGLLTENRILFCYEDNYKGPSATTKVDFVIDKNNIPLKISWVGYANKSGEIIWK